jgi:predicted negative regulator of RcsB-dependent stress response
MKGLRKAFVAIFVFGVAGSVGYYYWLKKKKNT